MTFHISQSLLLERTLAISATIILFGIVAIGSLYLIKRLTRSRGHRSVARDDLRTAEIEAIFRRFEAITRRQN
jgi:hypothetical protein